MTVPHPLGTCFQSSAFSPQADIHRPSDGPVITTSRDSAASTPTFMSTPSVGRAFFYLSKRIGFSIQTKQLRLLDADLG